MAYHETPGGLEGRHGQEGEVRKKDTDAKHERPKLIRQSAMILSLAGLGR